MTNKISRLGRLSAWGAGLRAGLAAMAALFMVTTLSSSTAQQPAPTPPAATEAPATPAPEAAPPAADTTAPVLADQPAPPPADQPAAASGEIKAAAPTINKGDDTWMLISTVLVLIMIVPGLALFYGGLVRQKNMLSVLMQVSTVMVVGMLAWAFWGYSLAFTDGGGLNS